MCGGSETATVLIAGSGFLSEHGTELDVLWTALQGAPFNGSSTFATTGTVLSDSLVEVGIPVLSGSAQVTITITLPGMNSGTSPPQTLEVGGELVGPFPGFDGPYAATGNVTFNLPAPGVLADDEPAECGGEVEKRGWAGGPQYAGVLTVVAPPAGSEDDATPGIWKMTEAAPASGERGMVRIQADGSFEYEPPLGYEGTDSFWYWMEDDARPGESRTARVTLAVNKVVWFIRDTVVSPAGGVGTGRFSDPFDSVLSFNSAQNAPPVTDPFDFPPTLPIPPNPDNAPQEGDCIFIYENVTSPQYDEGIRLRDQQQLVGEGVGLFLNNTPIVPAGIGPNPNPTLTNSGIALGEEFLFLPVITLGNANIVRGIDIDEPPGGGTYGDGIFGFDISGPTTIDSVRIMNAVGSGIRLDSVLAGTIQVGDPAQPGFPRVEILDCGEDGIEITGPSLITGTLQANPTAIVGGATLAVFETLIDDPGFIGIEAADVNLDVDSCEIDGYGSPGFGADYGISMTNFFTGATCTCSIVDTAVGRNNEQDGDIGITIIPFVTGDDIIAVIRGCLVRSPWQAVGLGPSVGSSGAGRLFLEVDDNTFERTSQPPVNGDLEFDVPTVWVRGGDTRETYITTMDNNYVIGNGLGGGCLFQYVTFDADANPGNGIQQTQATGNTRLGQGAPQADRVFETALVFQECAGDLRFETLNIFQFMGDPTGIDSFTAAVLNLAFTNAPNVDVLP